MKRPLFTCGLCFVVSTAVCYYLGIPVALSLAALVAAGGLLLLKDSRPLVVACAVAALAAAGIQGAFVGLRVLPVTALAGERCHVVVTLTQTDFYGGRMVGEGLADITAPDGTRHRRVGVRVSAYGDTEWLPGDSLEAEAAIAPVGLREDTLGRHLADGRYITVNLPPDCTRLAAPAHPRDAHLARLRHRVADATCRAVGGNPGALLSALLTGDRRALSDRATGWLKASGLTHLTAVSGLHVTLAAGAVVALWPGKKKAWGYAAGAALAFAYAGLAGFAPSSLRAAVMFLIFALAQLLRRRPDGLTSLAVAGVCLCTINPLVVGSVGFQLSFLATLGILVTASPVTDTLTDLITARRGSVGRLRLPVASLAASVGATLFTAPVMALTFGYLPLLGLLANLLVVAVVPLVLGLAGLVAFLALCLPGAVWVAAPVARLGAGYILGVARLVSAMPFAVYRITESYQIVLITGLALMGIGLIRVRPGRRCTTAALLCTLMILSATFLGGRLLYPGGYEVITFEGMDTTLLLRHREAVVLDLPDSAYEVGRVADAMERLGVRQVSFVAARRPGAVRLLGERLPVLLCATAGGSHPLTAEEALPTGAHIVTAMGLTIGVEDGAVLHIAGEGGSLSQGDYAILRRNPVRLRAPLPETERTFIRRVSYALQ